MNFNQTKTVIFRLIISKAWHKRVLTVNVNLVTAMQ